MVTSWPARVARLWTNPGTAERHAAGDAAYFEGLYEAIDPWGFAELGYEAEKYRRTLDLCGPGPFRSALEMGCSEGVFTEMLAPRCRSLRAVDISPTAVGRARRRLERFPWVRVDIATLPAWNPDGQFDLIVASDVLYYLSPRNLAAALSLIGRSLAPGGRFVALHYALPFGRGRTGATVHDELAAGLSIPRIHTELREFGVGRPYRIDVWQRPDRE
jgi:SAM-dependent methyltransferase